VRGYRTADEALLRGYWLPRELIAEPFAAPPPLAQPITVPAHTGSAERLYIVPGTAYVRYTELDWVARHGRLEVGLATRADWSVGEVLGRAVTVGFQALGLHRVYGALTPTLSEMTEVVAAAGFRREAVVPRGVWHDGFAHDREVWGMLCDDRP
jgi:hypothetical protein